MPQLVAKPLGQRFRVGAETISLSLLPAALGLLSLEFVVVRLAGAQEDPEEVAAFVLARQPLGGGQGAPNVPRRPAGGDEHLALVDHPAAGREE